MSDKLQPQGQTYSPSTWHLYCRQRFLGADDVALPNGKTLTVPRSTAELDTDEFAAYLDEVQEWAGRHGAWLDE